MTRPLLPYEREILACAAPGPVTLVDVLRATRASGAKVKQRLGSMVRRGLLVRVADGVYARAERAVAA